MGVIEPSNPTEHDFKELISALLYSICRQTPFSQQLPSGNCEDLRLHLLEAVR